MKIYRIADNDYDPAWDYNIDPRPIREIKRLVDSILTDTKPLQDALGFETVNVAYITGDNSGSLARYIDGTKDNPHFVMSTRIILYYARKYGNDLWTAVETTLVHEFGHAYLDMCGAVQSEEDVEDFAHTYNMSHDVETAKKVLDDYVENYSGEEYEDQTQ